MALHTLADNLSLVTPRGEFTFSSSNGALLAVTVSGGENSIWQSGPNGLWSAHLADKQVISATNFAATNAAKLFTYHVAEDRQSLELVYHSQDISIKIEALSLPDGMELRANVTPHRQTLLRLDLPERLTFAPADVKRFIIPQNSNSGLGVDFKRTFFEEQPEEPTLNWHSSAVGPMGYRQLLGAPLVQRKNIVAPSQLSVGEVGAAWLPPKLIERVNRTTATVNRASTREQAEIVVVDSPDGPYFCANRLGGVDGGLWRFGGSILKSEGEMAIELVTAAIRRVIPSGGVGRKQIALVDLAYGPPAGSWSDI